MTSTSPSSTPSGWFLVCIAGPDQGKRLALSSGRFVAGRGARCHLLCDDPDVADEFATLDFDGSHLRVSALTTLTPFIDGHPVNDASLAPGQQLRLGRSVWRIDGPGSTDAVFGFVSRIGDHLSSAAGVERPREWNAREMFADVTKKHADEEIESFFTVGTASTTPSLEAIDATWPKPWIFVRVFGMVLVLYVLFAYAWNQFYNENLIPGLIMIGAVAVPLALLIFFFEVNVPRNISLYQVVKLVLFGGLVSIVVSLFFFQWTNLDNVLGAAAAGIIEETGKGLTLLLVVRKPRYRWTLNGLLLGAAVGTGFAVFESAGYAFRAGVDDGGSAAAMFHSITERGLLSVLGGHVLWTGLVGAALWRVRGDQPFRSDMLVNPKFLRVVAICMLMHMIWNYDGINLPLYGKYVILGAAAWLLVLGMIQDGLKQVRSAQAATSAAPATSTT
ncbi:MAG: PrsW family glutamic-type intramembrane protease [Gemmatimonadales bacterium]